jgi:tetratricopeptide (TPR) repeat protein
VRNDEGLHVTVRPADALDQQGGLSGGPARPRVGPVGRAAYTGDVSTASDRDSTFALYRRGIELLEEADFEQATPPLEAAARRAPEKSSVREALGRAYFRSGRFAAAAAEFEAVVDVHQVNDYAHFCLGRALAKTGQTERARHHLALASNLRPDRRDYRFYREQLGT